MLTVVVTMCQPVMDCGREEFGPEEHLAHFGDFLFSFEFNMGCETKDVSILHFCVFYMVKIC